MPKTARPGGDPPAALRRAWTLKAAPAAAIALTATALAGALPAHAAGTPTPSMAARSSDVSTYAAAALIVGGTSSPTLGDSLMSQMWPVWRNSLGLANTFEPKLISVPYPAQLYPFTSGDYLGASVSAGVKSLLSLLNTTYNSGEHLIVWGISQGALVLDAAQRALAVDPAAPPPGSLTFVRVADPAAEITGMLNFLPNLVMSEVLHVDDAMRTAPGDSQYNSIVVTNEYDAFADFPDKPWHLLAIANAIVGLWYRHGQTGAADLTGVPAQDITTTINSLGATTTTYVVPSPFLPLTQLLRDAGVAGSAVDRIDKVLRPIVDSGYSRNDPETAAAQSLRTPPARAARRGSDRATSARRGALAPKFPAVPTPLAATSATTRTAAASAVRSTTHPSTNRPSNHTR